MPHQLKHINFSSCVLKSIIVGCTLVFCTSCRSIKETSEKSHSNLSSIYNPSKSALHPSYKIFHNNENTSILYFKVYTNELLFQPIGEKGALKSEISVSYSLINADDESKPIVDSGTYNFSIYKNGSNAFYINQFPINARSEGSYKIRVIMRDRLRRNLSFSFIDVEKKTGYGEQFFNLTNTDGTPLFRNVLIGNGAFRIIHTRPSSDKLYVSYYLNDTPLPKPTFAVGSDEFIYGTPDSVYVLDYSPTLNLVLAYEGMYFIQFDTTSQEGISLTKFDDDFPKITTSEKMLEPLAYITTTGEYEKLLNSTNKKLAADNFWIKSAGSTDRGRELIRVFYNRVYYANYYFTNTKPGWKTDRGMVYIVYGSPQDIKKTAESETWYYYLKNSPESISFKFDYRPNKYNLNYYALERSENFTWHWREAVYFWTNGKIFLQD